MTEIQDRQDYMDIGCPNCDTSCMNNWLAELCFQSYSIKNVLVAGFANIVTSLNAIATKMP